MTAADAPDILASEAAGPVAVRDTRSSTVEEINVLAHPMVNAQVRRLVSGAVAILGVAALAGCANLNTISRTTTLANSESDPKTTQAIHLDVQQRLVIVNSLNKYCAEPSPDAMAAYAAALGFGASAAAKGSVSASGGGQSNAASIGLRTQSITLMRDALYRMCEAYANGGVGDAQVVTLLNRSQDLTAVILAVEQLTGAVAANQATLTGSTNANSYATALNNSKLFAEATANEARALERLEESKQEQAAAGEKLEQAQKALDKANTALTTLEEADPAAPAEKIDGAKAEVTFRTKMRERAAAALKAVDARVELSQRVYDNAQGVAAEIAKTPDSSSASSAAGTSGSAELGAPGARSALSKEATVAVAEAVKSMVDTVLKKDYVIDSCMSVITSNLSVDPATRERQQDSREFCQRLINAQIMERAILTEARVELAKKQMISTVTGDLDKIMNCIAPTGSLERNRRDQLLKDANDNGAKIEPSLVTAPANASEFRTMLGLNGWVRAQLASVVAESAACK